MRMDASAEKRLLELQVIVNGDCQAEDTLAVQPYVAAPVNERLPRRQYLHQSPIFRIIAAQGNLSGNGRHTTNILD